MNRVKGHIYSKKKNTRKTQLQNKSHTLKYSHSTYADRKKYENVYIGHEGSAAYNPIGHEATRLTQIIQEVKKKLQIETAATSGCVKTALE